MQWIHSPTQIQAWPKCLYRVIAKYKQNHHSDVPPRMTDIESKNLDATQFD